LLLFNTNKKQRRADKPDTARGDLVLPTATFLITDTGVLCQLKPPLSRLSGHYPWEKIPFGIATLKLLVTAPETDAFDFMIRLFSDDEKDMLEKGFGKLVTSEIDVGVSMHELDDSAYLAHDIEQVLSWTPNLASRCPMSWVSHDLLRLREMQPSDLGNYVGSHIGLA
jgi:hypothetical protein